MLLWKVKCPTVHDSPYKSKQISLAIVVLIRMTSVRTSNCAKYAPKLLPLFHFSKLECFCLYDIICISSYYSIHNNTFEKMTSINLEQQVTFRSIQNSICAGYIAGSVGLLVGHPLDSLKVLLQVQVNHTPVTSVNSIANNSSSCNLNGGMNASSTTINTNTANTKLPNNGNSGSNSNNILVRSLHTLSNTKGNGMNVQSAALPSSTSVNASSNIATTTATNTCSNITTSRSIRSLYSGIGIPLLTVGLLQSTNFMLYDSIRRLLFHSQHLNSQSSACQSNCYLHDDSLTNVCIASGLAGSVLSLVTSPLQIVKTFQQIMPHWNVPFILKTVNAKALYAGFGAHFACDTFGRMVYFGMYEGVKREFIQYNNQNGIWQMEGNHGNIAMWQRMVSAAVAGMTCWTVIFPADVVRCRVYHRMISSVVENSAPLTSKTISNVTSLQMAKEIFQSNKHGFYRNCGFGLTVMRAGPVAAAVLPVYDVALEWLSSQ